MDSPPYLLTIGLIASFVVAAVAYATRRVTKLSGHVVFHGLVAAVSALPFAFLTAARNGPAADLLKEYGLWPASVALSFVVGAVATVVQQIWTSSGPGRSTFIARFIGNWLLSGAALIAYLVILVTAWMMAVVVAIGDCC